MTETTWLSSPSPQEMLQFLADRGFVSERKLRLFAVACCRLIWELILDAKSREAIEVAERFADGLASEREIARLSGGRYRLATSLTRCLSSATAAVGWAVAHPITASETQLCCRHVADATFYHLVDSGNYRKTRHHFEQMMDGFSAARNREQADYIRDIFPTPFHPVSFDSSWRTETVVSLTRSMYESRDFSAMPLLADALMDADCNEAEVLEHCRGNDPHVRGCFVVDFCLGLL
jgi:hypothetical protein